MRKDFTPRQIEMYLISLCFDLLNIYILCFLQIEVSWTILHWANLSVPFFQYLLAHFISLCHSWVILEVFQTFSLSLRLFWWSVIGKIAKLINACVLADQPLTPSGAITLTSQQPSTFRQDPPPPKRLWLAEGSEDS